MNTIWKFELKDVSLQKVSIPQKCKLLHVANHGDVLCLWAEVDTTSRKTDIEIEIVGTGDPISPAGDFRRVFIGTALMNVLVQHVYERQSI